MSAAHAGIEDAVGVDYAETYESGPGGITVNGYVQFSPGQVRNDAHVKQAYNRFTREAGPAVDTGRLYTALATNPESATLYPRHDSVKDSLLSGAKYVTHHLHGWIYFPAGCQPSVVATAPDDSPEVNEAVTGSNISTGAISSSVVSPNQFPC